MFFFMNTNLLQKTRMHDRQKKVGLFSSQKNSPTFFCKRTTFVNRLVVSYLFTVIRLQAEKRNPSQVQQDGLED